MWRKNRLIVIIGHHSGVFICFACKATRFSIKETDQLLHNLTGCPTHKSRRKAILAVCCCFSWLHRLKRPADIVLSWHRCRQINWTLIEFLDSSTSMSAAARPLASHTKTQSKRSWRGTQGVGTRGLQFGGGSVRSSPPAGAPLS